MEAYVKQQGLAFFCSDMARIVASSSMPAAGSQPDESSPPVPLRTSRETLIDMANAYGGIVAGTHTVGAPIEYIWRCQRNRVALCFRIVVSLSTLANDLLRHNFSLSAEDAARSDVISLLVGENRDPVPALSSINMRHYAFHFVLLNCTNFPWSLFESIVDMSTSICSRRLMKNPRWVFLRTMLLFLGMKECVEDLAAGLGQGNLDVEHALVLLQDWHRGFLKSGLDSAMYRPPACRASVCTGYSVTPYPPQEVCRVALCRLTQTCSFPDILAAFVDCDEWYLWITAGHEGAVASAMTAM